MAVFPVRAPVITIGYDDVPQVMGWFESGRLTNDTLPMLQGSGEPGTRVLIRDGDALLGTALVDAGWQWTFTPTEPLTQGVHAFAVTGERLDGSGFTAGQNEFVIEVGEDPVRIINPPTLTGVLDDVAPYQGLVADGDITNDALPVLHGKGDASTLVTIYDNGIVLGHTTVDDAGDWAFTPTAALAPGRHDLTVVGSLPDGSGAQEGWGRVIVVGPDPVAAPVIVGAIDDVGPAQGALHPGGDLPTDDRQPTLTGTGEPGSVVTVSFDAYLTPVGTTQVNADGQWSVTVDTPMADGMHSFYASASRADGQGQVVFPRDHFDVAVAGDGTGTEGVSQLDMPPVVTSITDKTGPVQGDLVDGFGWIDDPQPEMKGTALPGTHLEVLDHGVKIGEVVTAVNDWNWSFRPDTPLAAGDHALTVRAIPQDGTAPVDAPYTWLVTESATAAPVPVPVITDVLVGEIWREVYGRVPDGGAISNGDFLLVKGTGVPGSQIEVFDNEAPARYANVGSDWTWELLISSREGHHELSAVAFGSDTDLVGTPAPYHYVYDVASTGPVSVRPPVLVDLIDDVGAVQGEIGTDALTDDATPTLKGTAEPGLRLEILDGAVPIGEALVGDDWQWTFTPATPLVDGYHAFLMRSSTTDGSASNVSADWRVFVVDTSTAQSVDTLLANAGLPAADATVAPVPVSSPAAAPVAQAAVFLSATAAQHDLAY